MEEPAPTICETAIEQIILGSSETIRRLRGEISAIARHPVRALLVRGESGVGKELVPRALLACRPGPNLPLETLNCPAIPADHLESELFGTTRGAYPGAVNRAGAAERAGRGILFLDEISAMPPSHQSKLLRFFENREGRRLGATQPYRVAATIVAATNEDLAALIRQGLFREDLYYRLVQDGDVYVPPLRERREDLEILSQAFLSELPFTRRLASGALELLNAHAWPGNVRELRAVLRCAARLASDPLLEGPAIREAIDRVTIRADSAAPDNPIPGEPFSFHASTDDLRRALLLDALERARGNKTVAGFFLGFDRKLRPEKGAELGSDGLDLRARKLAHRKFRYWWDRLVVAQEQDSQSARVASASTHLMPQNLDASWP